METVIAKIRSMGVDLPAESVNRLMQCVSRRCFTRRQKMVEAGARGGYAYFIEKGITRSYWLVDGQEITTSFSLEGSVVFSMDEMYYGKESEEYVEAVEAVEAYAIAVADLRKLWTEDAAFARWALLIHQDEYRRLHRSHKERLTLAAAERYEAFRTQFPEVCRRARLGDIASYLGLTLPTLSRLRAKK
jgi:CRP-like cAMP-binding protein